MGDPLSRVVNRTDAPTLEAMLQGKLMKRVRYHRWSEPCKGISRRHETDNYSG